MGFPSVSFCQPKAKSGAFGKRRASHPSRIPRAPRMGPCRCAGSLGAPRVGEGLHRTWLTPKPAESSHGLHRIGPTDPSKCGPTERSEPKSSGGRLGDPLVPTALCSLASGVQQAILELALEGWHFERNARSESGKVGRSWKSWTSLT